MGQIAYGATESQHARQALGANGAAIALTGVAPTDASPVEPSQASAVLLVFGVALLSSLAWWSYLIVF